jgi:hypothetical protein
MQFLISLIEDYAAKNNGRYPESLHDISVPRKDPWSNDYYYKYPGDNGYYDLLSYGADGQPGGIDENADVSGPYDPKQRKAWNDMQFLISLIEDYAVKHKGEYPENLSKISPPINDPWHAEYRYEVPGKHGKYDLYSFGADKKEGGDKENADITSWAESSLIGTWYEYTPTSAMDIRFSKLNND